MLEQNWNKPGRPVMRMDDVWKPAELVAKLERSVRQKRESVRIIVKVRLGFCSVNTVSSKAKLMVNKIDFHSGESREICHVDRSPFLPHSYRNPHRAFKFCKLVSVNLVIARHNDFDFVSSQAQISCHRGNSVRKPACLCKRNSLCAHHQYFHKI